MKTSKNFENMVDLYETFRSMTFSNSSICVGPSLLKFNMIFFISDSGASRAGVQVKDKIIKVRQRKSYIYRHLGILFSPLSINPPILFFKSHSKQVFLFR